MICPLSDDRSLYDKLEDENKEEKKLLIAAIAGSLIRLICRQPEVLINPAKAPKHGFNLQLFVHVFDFDHRAF